MAADEKLQSGVRMRRGGPGRQGGQAAKRRRTTDRPKDQTIIVDENRKQMPDKF